MKNQQRSVLILKREAPDICPVCPMVNPALNPGCNQRCSGAGTRGNGVPTPFHILLWNGFEAVLKRLFFGCISTPFLLALHPWVYVTVEQRGESSFLAR